jgi:hypothetical protein
MVIDRAAATGLSRCDERVRAAAAAADEQQDKDAETLALRHQLSVLQRQLGPDRVRFTPGDRALLASQSDAADGRRRDQRRQRIALSRNGPPVCAPARLQATETASGRSRVDQAVPSLPPWLLSLITAGQRDADVLAMSRCACRQLTPERRCQDAISLG